MTYPYPVPAGVEIEWETDVRDDRQDACWYTDVDAIATVRYRGVDVMVDRNGEMAIYHGDDIIRDSSGLESIGITNDIELADADPDLSWGMNPWFDCYLRVDDGSDPHLDLVNYSVYDAVNDAIDWLVTNA